VDGALLVAHIIGYLAAVLLVLSPVQAVAFVLVQQGLFGACLGCSFVPNHTGMPSTERARLRAALAWRIPAQLTAGPPRRRCATVEVLLTSELGGGAHDRA